MGALYEPYAGISSGHHTPSLKRKDRHSDKEFNRVDFMIMSLLVTLCLERNPVNLQEPATGQKVATGQTAITVVEADCFRQSVAR